MAGFRACGMVVMAWWFCAVIVRAMPPYRPPEPVDPVPPEPVDAVPPEPVDPVPPEPVEEVPELAAVDEERPVPELAAVEERPVPELAAVDEERPVPPESAAAAPSSSSESTEAEAERRRRRELDRRRREEQASSAADRREEAMLRILVELQAQTRTMHDNHRELMDRVLSLASQTAQTATAEKSAPSARRAPRPRCNTCVACTVAPPPGTRRAPCESWRTSAAPSTPAPGSAPKTPRGADGRFIRRGNGAPSEALTSTGEESPTPRLPVPDQELDELFVDDEIPASLEGEKKKKKKDKKRRRLLAEPSDKDHGDGHGGPGHDGDGHGGPDGGCGAPVSGGRHVEHMGRWAAHLDPF